MTPKLHLIFKTHLDVGFTGYARDVRNQYHEYFIPMALDTGEHFLKEDPVAPQFIWTTGSWLIWDHLMTQPTDKVVRMEKAIASGIIRWHGLPFTFHTELLSPALAQEALSISHELDARFGKKTIAAKMTDVPGHTVGLVPLLAAAGIRFLHIGVNAASTPPDVPAVFRWRSEDGSEVVVMYQNEYGTTMIPDGMQDGIAFAHTMDNMGPQNVGHVLDGRRELEQANPAMTIQASTLDAFAELLLPIAETLPVVEQEIGDTWIHGVGSAPKRMARYLSARRTFDRFATQKLTPSRRAFGRKLMEVAEHTWGVDIKTYLRDEKAWDRVSFEVARRSDPRFAFTEGAWAEQDTIIDEALAELSEIDKAAIERNESASEAERPWSPIQPQQNYRLGSYDLQFDPVSGGLRLLCLGDQVRLAASGEREAPFAVIYESYDGADMDAYQDSYLTVRYRLVVQDHGKPGLENAATATSARFSCREAQIFCQDETSIEIVARMEPAAHNRLGAPHTVRTVYRCERDALRIIVTLIGKPANRMPEAGFLAFGPDAQSETWALEKLGQSISPLSIVRNGNRQLHAVDAVRATTRSGAGFVLKSIDAPLFCLGDQPLLPHSRRQPDMSAGGRFVLFNNKWGTNFSMWCEGDLVYRFDLSVG